MKHVSRVNAGTQRLSVSRQNAIRKAGEAKVTARQSAVDRYFGDELETLRDQASAIRDHSIAHLGQLLEQFEIEASNHGMVVHWAETAHEARQIIGAIVQEHAKSGDVIAKAKSMVTEEIHLNAHLESLGFRPVETDLGEYIVQLDNDTPSHIVTPIIHKSRQDVAQTFAKHGLGPYSEDPETLTLQARAKLRSEFQSAAVGISGANFVVAETGRIVLVENEGNNRFSTTAPRVHIAVMGIEKVVGKESDLAPLLRLLALSSTGQQLTTYVHWISGPRQPGQHDGPEEVHVVILDNGRTNALASEYRDILKCIRCGACLNVCPVYRAASGHAYEHVYPGPMGAVWVPATQGVENSGDVAFASTLCGACDSVCPVRIPLSDLLVKLRRDTLASKHERPYAAFAQAATQPALWKTGLTLLPLAGMAPVDAVDGWLESHEWPRPEGRSLRRWLRGRS